MDKQHQDDTPDAHADGPDQPDNAARRKLIARGGVVAGGLAAFAAGYGETVAKAVKGLAQSRPACPPRTPCAAIR